MIFYFSGTGNSRWAAEQLAALTGDEAQDICGFRQTPEIRGLRRVGLVFPVYAWGAPETVLDFAKSLGETDAFTYGVCTCGEEAGKTMVKLGRIFPLRSCYSLVMPNNYVIGGDVDDPGTARRKISAAQEIIRVIAREILEEKESCRVDEGTHPRLKSGLVNFGFNKFARSTRPFFATDDCNGCGRCARGCPAGTISLKAGKPAWGKKCYQCLRYINECPLQAIQYGKDTRGRSRYTLSACWPESGETHGEDAT